MIPPTNTHQQKQIEIINQIESHLVRGNTPFSTVTPVDDFEHDPRMCLTSVHFPSAELKSSIHKQIIEPLSAISPNHFYYPDDSLHMTIKNIRVVDDPPRFSATDEQRAQIVFSRVIPHHKKFQVYFYRLLLFPNNIALIGTTDPELDSIIFDLDSKLTYAGIPDDKTYLNADHFFCNMTLARFSLPVTTDFKKRVSALSSALQFAPYTIDSVSLITCNAAMKRRQVIGTWRLK